jgi:hypothetical protein
MLDQVASKFSSMPVLRMPSGVVKEEEAFRAKGHQLAEMRKGRSSALVREGSNAVEKRGELIWIR